jgi:hypothetical protein
MAFDGSNREQQVECPLTGAGWAGRAEQKIDCVDCPGHRHGQLFHGVTPTFDYGRTGSEDRREIGQRRDGAKSCGPPVLSPERVEQVRGLLSAGTARIRRQHMAGPGPNVSPLGG